MSAAPSPPPFTAILSTAGSRKTTQLTERAVAHVLAGRANPEEILLTTLTRSAAAQLHERSVEQFLDQTRKAGSGAVVFLDHCHRLEHAAIGTLHSLGLAVLRRAALTNGQPGSPRVLSAQAERDLILETAATLPADETRDFFECARRIGRHDPGWRRTVGVAALDDLLATIGVMRRMPIRDRDNLVRICKRSFAALAKELPKHLAAPENDLEASLQQIVPLRGKGVDDKILDNILARGHWGSLTGLKKASDPTMNGWAKCLHTAPHFHADCEAYGEALARVADATFAAYMKQKHRQGLVDYHDQEAALRKHGWVEPVSFIGCDEVQDLAPRQIKTLKKLLQDKRHSSAVWVGDEHQQLFGYQGASWPAAHEAIGDLGGAVTAVHDNYRSSPLLVGLFNKLFTTLPKQTACRDLTAGEATHVERWLLDYPSLADKETQYDQPTRQKLHASDEAKALAAGVADLLTRRPALQPGDIAIIVRTNSYADAVIQALNAVGIPVDASPRSLGETREGRVVVEALRLLADPADTLAAAVISHLVQDWSPGHEPTAWFWQSLAHAGSPATLEVAGLTELVADRDLASRLSPTEAVQQVIAALDLSSRLAAWGAAAGRQRNLDGMAACARSYEAQCLATHCPPTIAGLAALFDNNAEQEEGPQHARAATGGVTVTTTHSAKGGGWPVAIVAQCGWQPTTGDSTFTIREYDHVDPASRSHKRRVHVLPWAFGTHSAPVGKGGFTRYPHHPEGAKRADLHEGPYGSAAAELPGSQAIAVSDRKAEQHNVFVACTRAKNILVIAHPPRHIPNKKKGTASPTRLDFLQPALNDLLPPNAAVGVSQSISDVSAPGSLDYTRFEYSSKAAVVAATPPPAAVVSAASVVDTITAFKSLQHADPYPLEYPPADGSLPAPDGKYPRRFWNPSDEPASHTRGIDPAKVTVVSLASPPLPHHIAAGITRANDNAVGNAIHAFFAALPSLAALPVSRRDAVLRDIAHRCIAANGWRLPLDADDLVERAKAFEQWVATENLDLITELPLVVERNAHPATFWRGRIDALGISRSGSPPDAGTHIIDHKSATGSTPEWLASSLAETAAYATCVPTAVESLAIHSPLRPRITVSRSADQPLLR